MPVISTRAQAVLEILVARQTTERPFLLGQPTGGGKSEAAATWAELVAAGLVTETEVVKQVARYEIAAQGVTV